MDRRGSNDGDNHQPLRGWVYAPQKKLIPPAFEMKEFGKLCSYKITCQYAQRKIPPCLFSKKAKGEVGHRKALPCIFTKAKTEEHCRAQRKLPFSQGYPCMVPAKGSSPWVLNSWYYALPISRTSTFIKDSRLRAQKCLKAHRGSNALLSNEGAGALRIKHETRHSLRRRAVPCRRKGLVFLQSWARHDTREPREVAQKAVSATLAGSARNKGVEKTHTSLSCRESWTQLSGSVHATYGLILLQKFLSAKPSKELSVRRWLCSELTN